MSSPSPTPHALEPPLLLRNSNGRFTDISAASGDLFHKAVASRGVAFGDLDNNGTVDIAINCDDEPAIVALNRSTANHWLLIDPQGTVSNRDGIGAAFTS